MFIGEFSLEPTRHGLEARQDAPAWTPRRRPQPLPARPKARPELLAREEYIRWAGDALARGELVEFYGEAGVGKTALLRYLACVHPQSARLRYVVMLDAKPVDDLLQDVFDVFYLSPQETDHVPTRAERNAALREVSALLVLDAATLTSNDLATLREVAAECAVLLSSRRHLVWDSGEARTVTGLPTGDAVRLFERELKRPLADDELPIATEVCEFLQGLPWHVTRAAALIRDRDVALGDVRDSLDATRPPPSRDGERRRLRAREPRARLSELVEQELRPEERVIVDELRALSCPVHLRLFALLSDAVDIEPALKLLEDLGVVESHSPVYSLRGEESAAIDDARFARLVARLAAWADEHGDQVLEEARTLVPVLHAAAQRQPREAIRIARSLDAALPASGQWATWEAVLGDGVTAAAAVGAREDEAYFRHQLGTRALCLGQRSDARNQLRRARAERDDNRAGARLSEANLALVDAVRREGMLKRLVARLRWHSEPVSDVVTARGPGAGGVRWRAPALVVGGLAAAATAVMVAIGSSTAPPTTTVALTGSVITDSHRPGRSLKTPRVRFTNEAQLEAVESDRVESVKIAGADPSPDGLPRFQIVRTQSTCDGGAVVEAGEGCRIAVRVRPCGVGPSSATVVVRMKEGSPLRYPVTSVPCGSPPPPPGLKTTPEGTNASASGAAALQVTPKRLEFASVAGRKAAPQSVKLTTTGPQVKVDAQLDRRANGFSLGRPCAAPVGKDHPCTVTVRFRAGERDAHAILFIGASGALRSVKLVGNVVVRHLAGLSQIASGQTVDVTYTNDGDLEAQLTGADGVPPSVKIGLGTCAQAVSPGSACTIHVSSPPLRNAASIRLRGPEGLSVSLTLVSPMPTPTPSPSPTPSPTPSPSPSPTPTPDPTETTSKP
jgi:energy-coupling factor transporter ATP-binding protein EcfA2